MFEQLILLNHAGLGLFLSPNAQYFLQTSYSHSHKLMLTAEWCVHCVMETDYILLKMNL